MDIRHTVVSDLIDSGDRIWKHYVVSELFDEEHTSQICSIPLSKTSRPYEIIWRFDGSGCYTTKSGYRLLMDDQCGNSKIADVSLSLFYIALWSANVPSKIKIAMWKIVNGFLPTLAREFFREQDVVGIPIRHVGHPGPLHWKAPPLSVIKFNFDVTFNHQSQLSTTGVIGRNSQGLIMATCASPHSNVVDAFVAKVISCKQAELSLGFHSIIFSFVRRDANNAAHVLACECRSIQNSCYWIEEAPVGTTAALEVDRGFL
ncbi:hypothetical protein V6N11_050319 [Hibiscus sabdariffa]|uniref:RNase H type-1 domain-containing protein n=1 Tax=Hibiscus sabdariffa TaxID=183260 RepID=A0ABR2T9T2_9ROSI